MGMFGGTSLSPKREGAFQAWRAHLPEDLRNMNDYDLRGAWQSNAQAAANGHLPDTYKLPNHMTFSTGSQYSTPENPGGLWADTGTPNPQQPGQNSWVFWASPENLRQHSLTQLSDYFNGWEKGNTMVAPIRYSLPVGG